MATQAAKDRAHDIVDKDEATGRMTKTEADHIRDAIDRTPTDPDPTGGGGGDGQVGGGRTAGQILADVRAGRIGKGQARTELIQLAMARGAGAAEAAQAAEASLAGVVSPPVTAAPAPQPGGAAPIPRAGTVPPFLPEGERTGPVFSPFGEIAQDRRTAFAGARADMFPQGLASAGAQSLARQFAGLSPAFETLRGLGSIPLETPFPEFLGRHLGQGGIDPRAIAQQASGLFGQTGLTDPQSTFRTFLAKNPLSQFQLALQSGLQGLPAFLAPTFTDVAQEKFGQFQTGVPIDPTTGQPAFAANPFLPEFIRRGGRF